MATLPNMLESLSAMSTTLPLVSTGNAWASEARFSVAKMIRMFENMAPDVAGFPAGNAKADEMFYDTNLLLPEERKIAYASRAPEGSIIVVQPGGGDLRTFECVDTRLTATQRAGVIVDQLETWLKDPTTPVNAIDTVVIPGCGSSPVGAAAFGKTVAKILSKPVIAIVSGQGKLDTMFEICSGGALMGPTARLFSSVHLLMHMLVATEPFASWATAEASEFVEAIQEAATLKVLIERGLLTTLPDGARTVYSAGNRRLNTIVSHSKANWAVLATLLDFELGILPHLTLPKENCGRPIDVVTFGCWVDLPDRASTMGQLFHYHQFFGTLDALAMLNQAPQAVMRLAFTGHVDFLQQIDTTRSPDDMMILGCGHNLLRGNPIHMPIEKILPLI